MLRFIGADLRRMWMGALVVVLLVALAVALGLGVSLQERALRLGSARASEKFDLVIGARGSETQLVLSTVFLQPAALPLVPGAVLEALEHDPRVAWAAPVGFGDFYRGHPLIGTTAQLVAATAPGLSAGRMFAAEYEAVVGAQVDLLPGAEITPTHGEVTRGGHAHEGVNYTVTGRLKPTGTPWDRAILVPIEAVWHVHGMGGHPDADGGGSPEHAPGAGGQPDAEAAEPGVPAILVKPKSIADAYRLRQEYRTNPETLAVFPAEVLTGLYALMGDARQVLAAVAAGAQGLVAAALVLVTAVHIGQRRRQIGALRALGAPRGAIFALVWTELFALVLCGIGLGVAGGFGAALMLSQMIAARQGFALPVTFAPADFLALGGLAGLAAVLAALPAWLAYRQPAAAGLRG